MDKTEILIDNGMYMIFTPQSLPMHLEVKSNIPLYIRRIKKRLEDSIYE